MSDARSNNYNIFKRKGPLKVIAVITLWSFLFTYIGGDAFAAKLPAAGKVSESSSVDSDAPGSELNIATFTLPHDLGEIKSSWRSPKMGTVPTIIHIQDAHCNYAAQKKISEIIEYFNKEYGVNTVNLEGGAGSYDLSIFTDVQDKDTREKVSDYFVKEGLVSGAEYFAVNNPGKVQLWGIEDAGLYMKNLNCYRDSLKYKGEVDKDLATIETALNNLKQRIYSKELLDLDTKYTAYKENKLEFKDYVTYLIGKAEKMGTVPTKQTVIPAKAGIYNIQLLSQSLQLESQIDFKLANRERDALIDELQRMLSKKDLEKLVVKTVEFKEKRLGEHDYYGYLMEKSKLLNLDMSKYGELQKYIEYISLYSAIDKSKIYKEIEILEEQIKDSLYTNNEQRELNKLSKNFALLKNLFNFTLTEDDYTYYKANKDAFNMDNFVAFIVKKIGTVPSIPGGNARGLSLFLNHHRSQVESFYECSFSRDRAFLGNLKFQRIASSLQRIGHEKQGLNSHYTLNAKPYTLLITGGFHTENLLKLCKENGISYISIMPNFKNDTGYDCPYFNLLAGQQNPVETIIAKALFSTIAIANFCNKELSILAEGERAYVVRNLYVKWEIAKAQGKGLIIRHGEKELILGIDGEIISTAPKDLTQYDIAQIPTEEVLAGEIDYKITDPNKHDPHNFRYIVHAITLSRLDALIHNLQNNPEKIVLSASLIDQDHANAYPPDGGYLIVKVKSDDFVLNAWPHQGAFNRGLQLVEGLREKRKTPDFRLPRANEILEKTPITGRTARGFDTGYNELLLDGLGIDIVGVMVDKGDGQNPLLGFAEKHDLPVIEVSGRVNNFNMGLEKLELIRKIKSVETKAEAAPAKGVLRPVAWFAEKAILPLVLPLVRFLMSLFGIKMTEVHKNIIKEDIIVPIVEEGLMFMGLLSGGAWVYAGIRVAFIIAHWRWEYAPLQGRPRTPYEKIAIPTIISVLSALPVAFLGTTALSFITLSLIHGAANYYVTLTPESRLQKAVLTGKFPFERILSIVRGEEIVSPVPDQETLERTEMVLRYTRHAVFNNLRFDSAPMLFLHFELAINDRAYGDKVADDFTRLYDAGLKLASEYHAGIKYLEKLETLNSMSPDEKAQALDMTGKWFLDMQKFFNEYSEELDRWIEAIDQSEENKELVEQLRQFVKMTKEIIDERSRFIQKTHTLEDINLKVFLEGLFIESNMAGVMEADVVWESVPDDLSLKASRYLLSVIFEVLAENANKIYKRREGELLKKAGIGRDKWKVVIRADKEGDDVVIKVSDNAGGIAKNDLPEIFKLNFTRTEGTGLGLPLAKMIAEDHHGSISAENIETEFGKGAMFTIKLPVEGFVISERVEPREIFIRERIVKPTTTRRSRAIKAVTSILPFAGALFALSVAEAAIEEAVPAALNLAAQSSAMPWGWLAAGAVLGGLVIWAGYKLYASRLRNKAELMWARKAADRVEQSNKIFDSGTVLYLQKLYEFEVTQQMSAKELKGKFNNLYGAKCQARNLEFDLNLTGLMKEGSIRYYPFSSYGKKHAVRIFSEDDKYYLHQADILEEGDIDANLRYQVITEAEFNKIANTKNIPLRILTYTLLFTSGVAFLCTAIMAFTSVRHLNIFNYFFYFIQVDFFSIYLMSMAFTIILMINNFTHTVQIWKYVDKTPQPLRQFKEIRSGELPAVTIQLPIYNEANVVERLIDSACGVEYPKDKLQIQIVDDSTDVTQGIVDAIVNKKKEEGYDIEVVRRKTRTGYKGGALAFATRFARGDYIAIFDADFVVPQDFLKKTIPYFVGNDEVGVVQGVWTYLNEDRSLLTKLQALGLAQHMFVELTVKNRKGYFVHFHGTGGVWRKEAISKSGGWQIDTVTEDGDLSYRAQLAGYKIIYLDNVESPSELPERILPFKAQQARWTKGGVQVLRKVLPQIWHSNERFTNKVEITVRLALSLAVVPASVMLIGLIPVFIVANNLGLLVPFNVVFGIYFLIGYLGHFLSLRAAYLRFNPAEYKSNSFLTNIGMAFRMGYLGVGLLPVKLKAVYEALFNRESVFIRTPKDGEIKERIIKYNVSKEKIIVFSELAAFFYCLGMLCSNLLNFHLVAAIVFLQFTIGVGWIAYLSIKEVRQKQMEPVKPSVAAPAAESMGIIPKTDLKEPPARGIFQLVVEIILRTFVPFFGVIAAASSVEAAIEDTVPAALNLVAQSSAMPWGWLAAGAILGGLVIWVGYKFYTSRQKVIPKPAGIIPEEASREEIENIKFAYDLNRRLPAGKIQKALEFIPSLKGRLGIVPVFILAMVLTFASACANMADMVKSVTFSPKAAIAQLENSDTFADGWDALFAYKWKAIGDLVEVIENKNKDKSIELRRKAAAILGGGERPSFSDEQFRILLGVVRAGEDAELRQEILDAIMFAEEIPEWVMEAVNEIARKDTEARKEAARQFKELMRAKPSEEPAPLPPSPPQAIEPTEVVPAQPVVDTGAVTVPVERPEPAPSRGIIAGAIILAILGSAIAALTAFFVNRFISKQGSAKKIANVSGFDKEITDIMQKEVTDVAQHFKTEFAGKTVYVRPHTVFTDLFRVEKLKFVPKLAAAIYGVLFVLPIISTVGIIPGIDMLALNAVISLVLVFARHVKNFYETEQSPAVAGTTLRGNPIILVDRNALEKEFDINSLTRKLQATLAHEMGHFAIADVRMANAIRLIRKYERKTVIQFPERVPGDPTPDENGVNETETLFEEGKLQSLVEELEKRAKFVRGEERQKNVKEPDWTYEFGTMFGAAALKLVSYRLNKKVEEFSFEDYQTAYDFVRFVAGGQGLSIGSDVFSNKLRDAVEYYRKIMTIRRGGVIDPQVLEGDLRDIRRGMSQILPIVNRDGRDLTVYYPAVGFDIAPVLVSTDATRLIYSDLSRYFYGQRDVDNFAVLIQEIEKMGAKIISKDIPPEEKEGRCEIKFEFAGKDGKTKLRTLIYYSGVDADKFIPPEIEDGYDILWAQTPGLFLKWTNAHKKLFTMLKKTGFCIFGNNGLVMTSSGTSDVSKVINDMTIGSSLQFDENLRFADEVDGIRGYILARKALGPVSPEMPAIAKEVQRLFKLHVKREPREEEINRIISLMTFGGVPAVRTITEYAAKEPPTTPGAAIAGPIKEPDPLEKLEAKFGALLNESYKNFPDNRSPEILNDLKSVMIKLYKKLLESEDIKKSPEKQKKLADLFIYTFRKLLRQDEDDLALPFTPHGAKHSLDVANYMIRILAESPVLREKLKAAYGRHYAAIAFLLGLLHDIGYAGLKDAGKTLAKVKKGYHADLSADMVKADLAETGILADLFGMKENALNDFVNAILLHGADKPGITEEQPKGSGDHKYAPASEDNNPLLLLVRLADNLEITRSRLRAWQKNPWFIRILYHMTNDKALQDYLAKKDIKEEERQQLIDKRLRELRQNELDKLKKRKDLAEKAKAGDQDALEKLKSEFGIEDANAREIGLLLDQLTAPNFEEELTLIENAVQKMNHESFLHFIGALTIKELMFGEDRNGNLAITAIVTEGANDPVWRNAAEFQVNGKGRSNDALRSLTLNGKTIEIEISYGSPGVIPAALSPEMTIGRAALENLDIGSRTFGPSAILPSTKIVAPGGPMKETGPRDAMDTIGLQYTAKGTTLNITGPVEQLIQFIRRLDRRELHQNEKDLGEVLLKERARLFELMREQAGSRLQNPEAELYKINNFLRIMELRHKLRYFVEFANRDNIASGTSPVTVSFYINQERTVERAENVYKEIIEEIQHSITHSLTIETEDEMRRGLARETAAAFTKDDLDNLMGGSADTIRNEVLTKVPDLDPWYVVGKQAWNWIIAQALAVQRKGPITPGGPMKELGPREAWEALDEGEREPSQEAVEAWEKQARISGIVPDANVYAYVIEDTQNLLPSRVFAYHYGGPNKTNIIVVKSGVEYRTEGRYHEAREIWWEYRNTTEHLGLSQIEIHRLASAEQVLKFGQRDITLFHLTQLVNFAKDDKARLRDIIEEKEEKRKGHHDLIEKHLGPAARKTIEEYEKVLREKAEKLILADRSSPVFLEALKEIKDKTLQQLNNDIEQAGKEMQEAIDKNIRRHPSQQVFIPPQTVENPALSGAAQQNPLLAATWRHIMSSRQVQMPKPVFSSDSVHKYIPYFGELDEMDRLESKLYVLEILNVVYDTMGYLSPGSPENLLNNENIDKVMRAPCITRGNSVKVLHQLALIAQAVRGNVIYTFIALANILANANVTEDNIVNVLNQLTLIAQTADGTASAVIETAAKVIEKEGVTKDNVVSILTQLIEPLRKIKLTADYNALETVASILASPCITKDNAIDVLNQLVLIVRAGGGNAAAAALNVVVKVMGKEGVTNENIVGILAQLVVPIRQIAQAAGADAASSAFAAATGVLANYNITKDNLVDVLNQLVLIAQVTGTNAISEFKETAKILSSSSITKDNVVDVLSQLVLIALATKERTGYAFQETAKILTNTNVAKDNAIDVLKQLVFITRVTGTNAGSAFDEIAKILSSSSITKDNIVNVLNQFVLIIQAAGSSLAFQVVAEVMKKEDVTKDNVISVLAQLVDPLKQIAQAGGSPTFQVVSEIIKKEGITKDNIASILISLVNPLGQISQATGTNAGYTFQIATVVVRKEDVTKDNIVSVLTLLVEPLRRIAQTRDVDISSAFEATVKILASSTITKDNVITVLNQLVLIAQVADINTGSVFWTIDRVLANSDITKDNVVDVLSQLVLVIQAVGYAVTTPIVFGALANVIVGLQEHSEGITFDNVPNFNTKILITKLTTERRFKVPDYLAKYLNTLNNFMRQRKTVFSSADYIVDETQARRWDYSQTESGDLTTLLSREGGYCSGHLAIHQTKNLELMKAIITAGYIVPVEIFDVLNENNQFMQMVREGKFIPLGRSEFVHFSIDRPIGYIGSPYAIVYPVEMLLENQAFMYDPVGDWPVGGYSANPEHSSHRIPVRNGILLIPEQAKEEIENLFGILEQEYKEQGWRRPNKIFYYRGNTTEEGLKQLKEQYELLEQTTQIRISRKPVEIRQWSYTRHKEMVLFSIKDVSDVNGVIHYGDISTLARLSEVQDFSLTLEDIVNSVAAEMLTGDIEVKDTGSSKRGTYQERYMGFPDDFDLMVDTGGSIPNDAILMQFASRFVDMLHERGIIKATYGDEGEFTIVPDQFVAHRPERSLVKVKVFRGNEKNIPILSIDVNFFTGSQGADGIRYQNKFLSNIDRILQGLPKDEREAGRQHILGVIRSLKAIFKNNGVYTWTEGGLRGVGTEQLVMQLNGFDDEFGTPRPVSSLGELKTVFTVDRALQRLENAMFDQNGNYAGIRGFRNNLPLWDPGSLTPTQLTDRVNELALARLIDITSSRLPLGPGQQEMAPSVVTPGGPMKELGTREAWEALDEGEREPTPGAIAYWQEEAEKVTAKKSPRTGIVVKVVEDEGWMLPSRMFAYNFFHNGAYIIVVDPKHPEYRREAIYHEIREIYWIKRLTKEREIGWETSQTRKEGLKQVKIDAHRLASAEQVRRFGKEGLTPFHEYLLNQWIADSELHGKLRAILNERDRSQQHRLVEHYLGEEALTKVETYENYLKAQAAKLLAERAHDYSYEMDELIGNRLWGLNQGEALSEDSPADDFLASLSADAEMAWGPVIPEETAPAVSLAETTQAVALEALDEDAKVHKMVADLQKAGCESDKFESMSGPGDIVWRVYKHRETGLQLIEKRVKNVAQSNTNNIEVIKEFFGTERQWACPTFFVEGDDEHVFELDLRPFGYITIKEVMGTNPSNFTGEMKEFVRRAISETFRPVGEEAFVHGHLRTENILVKLDDASNIADVRIIDWKLLDKRKLRGDLRDFVRGERPDLRKAHLMGNVMTGFNFEGADLRDADLKSAILVWGMLKGADLSGAFLEDASLKFADLRGAKLIGADLRRSALWDADLSGADLTDANLRYARFNVNDLRGAVMRDTRFSWDRMPELQAMGFKVIDKGEWCEVTSAEKPTMVPEKAAPAVTPIQTRQMQTLEAFSSVNRRADTVRAVVGVPSGMPQAQVQSTLREVNRGLAENGFGQRTDNHQVITYEIDLANSEQTEKNYKEAIEKTQKELPPDGRIILFAPEMEKGPKLAGKAQEQYVKQPYITVIPDAYTDTNPAAKQYPDIMVRSALARLIAFCYNVKDPTSAISTINILLGQAADLEEPIKTIDDLLNVLKPLRIKAIDFAEIREWQVSQEAVATSL